MVSKTCVSIEKWLRKEWVGTVPYLITQMTVSLSGSPSATTHTGFSLGQTCQAFSSAVAKCRIIYCYPAHFLPYLPSYFFPPFSRPFGGMKPLSGRWADGDRQCPPAPKANWERPEKDCGVAEWSWHDGEINAGPSSTFAYSQGSTANVLSARSH